MSAIKALERQVVAELIDSLGRDPAWRWRNSDCDVLIGPSGIAIWTWSLTVRGPVDPVRFGFWNRRRIRRAIRHWKRRVGNEQAQEQHRRNLVALSRCLKPLRAAA